MGSEHVTELDTEVTDLDAEVTDLDTEEMAGLIWITGYSAAGKTTIGRKVESQLRSRGFRTVFLDGDDLRSIFGSHWGYDRDQRIDLARVYFRLCSHLASQGFTIILCAVAMYDEVSDWVRTNIPKSVQVYLRVPEAERRRRDKQTKRIYTTGSNFSSMYDEPDSPDLVIDNFGSSRPDEEANRIIECFRSKVVVDRDMGREEHWRNYYSTARAPVNPSPFALHVAALLRSPKQLIEIGCGNGRDASFLASQGHGVTALDRSTAAIERCMESHGREAVRFLVGKITDFATRFSSGFDVAYSRFVLHAMPVEEEIGLLRAAFIVLRGGGELHIECRSINDPLARKGEVISPTERIYGHYRRFIVLEDLINRVEEAGFEILSSLESTGLASFGDEDPVVIRVAGRKK